MTVLLTHFSLIHQFQGGQIVPIGPLHPTAFLRPLKVFTVVRESPSCIRIVENALLKSFSIIWAFFILARMLS